MLMDTEIRGFRKNQATIECEVKFNGPGLHNAGNTTVRLVPAPENHGIVFQKGEDTATRMKADWKYWINTQLCSTLDNGEGIRYRTVEHLLAALYACEIDNVLVKMDAEEVPILDGSARPLIETIKSAGVTLQSAPRVFFRIKNKVTLVDGTAEITIEPHDTFSAKYTLVLDEIGTMVWGGDISPGEFTKEIAPARTFGRLKTAWFAVILAKLRLLPILRGASLRNAMLVAKNRILSFEPPRFEEELSRHRILDITGDLMLAGAPVIGKVTAVRSGHRHNVALLREICKSDENWEICGAPKHSTNA